MSKKINIIRVGVIIALIYVGGLFVSQIINTNKLNMEISKQQALYEGLKEKNQQLQDEVLNMSKDNTYMERLGRERLGLIKEGETPVINSSGKK